MEAVSRGEHRGGNRGGGERYKSAENARGGGFGFARRGVVLDERFD